MRSAPFFFFFFLNFGLNRSFRPIRPIQARVGPIPGESARVGAASAWVGKKHVESTWHDADGRAGSGVPCASPRPTASDAGAAPLVPHPFFIALNYSIYWVVPVYIVHNCKMQPCYSTCSCKQSPTRLFANTTVVSHCHTFSIITI